MSSGGLGSAIDTLGVDGCPNSLCGGLVCREPIGSDPRNVRAAGWSNSGEPGLDSAEISGSEGSADGVVGRSRGELGPDSSKGGGGLGVNGNGSSADCCTSSGGSGSATDTLGVDGRPDSLCGEPVCRKPIGSDPRNVRAAGWSNSDEPGLDSTDISGSEGSADGVVDRPRGELGPDSSKDGGELGVNGNGSWADCCTNSDGSGSTTDTSGVGGHPNFLFSEPVCGKPIGNPRNGRAAGWSDSDELGLDSARTSGSEGSPDGDVGWIRGELGRDSLRGVNGDGSSADCCVSSGGLDSGRDTSGVDGHLDSLCGEPVCRKPIGSDPRNVRAAGWPNSGEPGLDSAEISGSEGSADGVVGRPRGELGPDSSKDGGGLGINGNGSSADCCTGSGGSGTTTDTSGVNGHPNLLFSEPVCGKPIGNNPRNGRAAGWSDSDELGLDSARTSGSEGSPDGDVGWIRGELGRDSLRGVNGDESSADCCVSSGGLDGGRDPSGVDGRLDSLCGEPVCCKPIGSDPRNVRAAGWPNSGEPGLDSAGLCDSEGSPGGVVSRFRGEPGFNSSRGGGGRGVNRDAPWANCRTSSGGFGGAVDVSGIDGCPDSICGSPADGKLVGTDSRGLSGLGVTGADCLPRSDAAGSATGGLGVHGHPDSLDETTGGEPGLGSSGASDSSESEGIPAPLSECIPNLAISRLWRSRLRICSPNSGGSRCSPLTLGGQIILRSGRWNLSTCSSARPSACRRSLRVHHLEKQVHPSGSSVGLRRMRAPTALSWSCLRVLYG